MKAPANPALHRYQNQAEMMEMTAYSSSLAKAWFAG
jgi:hypothetical protein